MLSGTADNWCQEFPDKNGSLSLKRDKFPRRAGYSSEVRPCWIANRTRPGTSRISSFSIMRLR